MERAEQQALIDWDKHAKLLEIGRKQGFQPRRTE